MALMWKGILVRILFFIFLSVSMHNYGWSQPWPDKPFSNQSAEEDAPDPPDPPPPDDGDPGHDPDLPLDSNILILVAAVVSYGLKKTWDVKRNSRRKNNLASTANFKDFTQ